MCPSPAPNMTTHLSPAGRALLRELEGLRTRMYRDSGGAPTIGIGHLLSAEELRTGILRIGDQLVTWRGELSVAQCEALLDQDIRPFADAVRRYVRVPLSAAQFDALVLFAYNVGAQAFRESTLLRLLNAGRYDAVPTQLRRWVRDNGRVVPGLVKRREREIEHWLSASVGEGGT